MSIQTATPYLVLSGHADAAIALYKEAFGASVVSLMRFDDMMPQCPDALKGRVMHAELRLDQGTVMLSDGSPEDVMSGRGAVNVALGTVDEAATRRAFDVLANGGAVEQPISPAPWGALYGAVTDRFGIHWMFNCVVSQNG